MSIHRYNLRGRIVCGATTGRVSTSGTGVTCPECLRLTTGQRPTIDAEYLRRMREGAKS